MAFMDKNVNFVLVSIIVILLLGAVGLALYFQFHYEKLNTRFQEKTTEAANLKEEVALLSNISSSLNMSLELKSSDISNLSGQYITEKVQKEELNNTLTDTKKDLDDTKNILSNTKDELQTTKTSLQTMTVNFMNMKTVMVKANASVIAYKNNVTFTRANMDTLRTYINDAVHDTNQSLGQCRDYLDEINSKTNNVNSRISSLEAIN